MFLIMSVLTNFTPAPSSSDLLVCFCSFLKRSRSAAYRGSCCRAAAAAAARGRVASVGGGGGCGAARVAARTGLVSRADAGAGCSAAAAGRTLCGGAPGSCSSGRGCDGAAPAAPAPAPAPAPAAAAAGAGAAGWSRSRARPARNGRRSWQSKRRSARRRMSCWRNSTLSSGPAARVRYAHSSGLRLKSQTPGPHTGLVLNAPIQAETVMSLQQGGLRTIGLGSVAGGSRRAGRGGRGGPRRAGRGGVGWAGGAGWAGRGGRAGRGGQRRAGGLGGADGGWAAGRAGAEWDDERGVG